LNKYRKAKMMYSRYVSAVEADVAASDKNVNFPIYHKRKSSIECGASYNFHHRVQFPVLGTARDQTDQGKTCYDTSQNQVHNFASSVNSLSAAHAFDDGLMQKYGQSNLAPGLTRIANERKTNSNFLANSDYREDASY
jgi:hypothetical protein